jgi:hypothetical protein
MTSIKTLALNPNRDFAYEDHIFGVCSGDPSECPYCNPPGEVEQCTDQPGREANQELPNSSPPKEHRYPGATPRSPVVIPSMTNFS